MCKKLILGVAVAVGSIIASHPAQAGFDSWTAEIENDPFSGGNKVTLTNMSSLRSGVLIMCDSAAAGEVMVRVIPGFEISDALIGYTPTLEFAVDGKKLFEETGETGSVGSNLAIAQATLSHENAIAFAEAFQAAKKQIAVKDGISDQPTLTAARGNTKAGKALLDCVRSAKAN